MSITKISKETGLERLSDIFEVPIAASTTTSEEFLMEGTLNCIVLGTTGSARVTTLQFLAGRDSLGVPIWLSTGVTATTSTSALTLIDSSALAAIAGLCGRFTKFRLVLAASDTLTLIRVWSRVG